MKALGIRSHLVRLGEAMATAGVVAIALVSLLGPLLGYRAIVLSGGSMAPGAGVGSLVVTSSVDPASIAVGDVISYRLPSGILITHRVTMLEDGAAAPSFIVKGDANGSPDPTPVPGSWVVGREVMAIPYVGYPVLIAARPWGLATMLGLASVLALLGGRRQRRGGPLGGEALR